MPVPTLVKTAAAATATAVVGGLASKPAQSAWYAALRKPSFQPPMAVFPVVWPVLYADLAVVSAHTVDRLAEKDPAAARAFTASLALNLILNGGWTWLFFTRRALGGAAVAAAALTISSADLTRHAARVRGSSGAALVAYPLWCAFATALSTRIWSLNRR